MLSFQQVPVRCHFVWESCTGGCWVKLACSSVNASGLLLGVLNNTKGYTQQLFIGDKRQKEPKDLSPHS